MPVPMVPRAGETALTFPQPLPVEEAAALLQARHAHGHDLDPATTIRSQPFSFHSDSHHWGRTVASCLSTQHVAQPVTTPWGSLMAPSALCGELGGAARQCARRPGGCRVTPVTASTSVDVLAPSSRGQRSAEGSPGLAEGSGAKCFLPPPAPRGPAFLGSQPAFLLQGDLPSPFLWK